MTLLLFKITADIAGTMTNWSGLPNATTVMQPSLPVCARLPRVRNALKKTRSLS